MCEADGCATAVDVARVEAVLRQRLAGRVWDLRVRAEEGGVVLLGHADSAGGPA